MAKDGAQDFQTFASQPSETDLRTSRDFVGALELAAQRAAEQMSVLKDMGYPANGKSNEVRQWFGTLGR